MSRMKGHKAMKKLLVCTVLFSFAGAVRAASCIISGSVERNCASEAYAIAPALESRVADETFARLPSFEARCDSEELATLSEFNSRRRDAFVFTIR
mgnify:CR=1 FL=1